MSLSFVISSQIMNNVISHYTTNKIKLNKEIELIYISNANIFLIFYDQIRNSNNNSFNIEKDKFDNTSKNKKNKTDDEIIKNDEMIKNNEINQLIN